MCGIAGILRFSGGTVHSNELKRMTDVIVHRGPDGEGSWIHPRGNVGMGHRRLSIIDLSENGSQPMHFADEKITLVFNGEIYNYIEIRNVLISKGYIFKSNSDTEVLLASYHYWGKDCLTRFNGFWSFVLWDESLQELWLVRDRFGIKPLYYCFLPDDQFVFASETKQFNHLDRFIKRPFNDLIPYSIKNSWGLEGYGKTIFENIEQVKAGHWMSITLDQKIYQYCWWNTSEKVADINSDYNTQVTDFLSLFEDSLMLRLRSDVPIATALSGGVDSSSVFKMLKKIGAEKNHKLNINQEWQKAFIATFPGTSQDETEFAKLAAGDENPEAIYFDISSEQNFVSKLLESIAFYDLISATPLHILDGVYSKMSDYGVKVSLDGHGVDEMLYGYPFLIRSLIDNYTDNKGLSIGELNMIYESMFSADERKMIINRNKEKSFIGKIIDKIFHLHPMKQSVPHDFFSIDHFYNIPEFQKKLPTNFVGSEKILYDAFHYDVLPTILRNFDLGSMKNSVEVRMPFMDYRIVTFLFSLPVESKVGNGYNKRILRDAMKGILPDKVRLRRSKLGLNAPLKKWFKDEMKELILDEISSASFLTSLWWNGRNVKNFIENKFKNGSWSESECIEIWPILNAHLLLNKK